MPCFWLPVEVKGLLFYHSLFHLHSVPPSLELDALCADYKCAILLRLRLSAGDSALQQPPLVSGVHSHVFGSCKRETSHQHKMSVRCRKRVPQTFSSLSKNLFTIFAEETVECCDLDLKHSAEKLDKGQKKFRMSAQAGWRQRSGSKWLLQRVIIGQNGLRGVVVETCLWPYVILQNTVREWTFELLWA